MKRPLGGVAGAIGAGGGGGVGLGGVAGAGAGAGGRCAGAGSGGRGPIETGGGCVLGSVWMVTVGGGGTGPSGGVAIFGAAVFCVAHPLMSATTMMLATNPSSLVLRRITRTRRQTAQKIRRNRSSARNDRWGD